MNRGLGECILTIITMQLGRIQPKSHLGHQVIRAQTT